MIGQRIGPYEVLAKLGEGGMGEVYRARDSKLRREVALKVLPADVAGDRERLSRFQREAEVLASLNHPHIAQIHGVEHADGAIALVMELVEGEDLSQRVANGPIPIDEAIPIASQIADALEAAHEQGIIHRDLKPANIKVRPDGTLKVLDFGLAKAHGPADAGARKRSSAEGPTITSPAMTQLGMILGTAAYMSPEQARGKPVDKRADIWAFGAVVYEMLTGTRAFKGEEVSDVLAAVLRQDVEWTRLPPNTPPRLRHLLERCLDRDPKTRLRDIGEARVELAKIGAGAPAIAIEPPAPAQYGAWIAWTVAAVAIVAAIVLYLRPPPAGSSNEVVRLSFVPPVGITFEAGRTDAIVVSPDGRQLLFSGRSTDGRRQLYVRSMDGRDAKLLPDTEEPITPFWSPDSQSVAFGAQGKLKRVELAGGRPTVLADAPRLNGGAWNRNGVILFVPDYNSGVLQVSDKGGAASVVTALDQGRQESALANPEFLPDGQHFLYTAATTERAVAGSSQIRWGSLSSRDTGDVVDGSNPTFVAPDQLLFERAGTLFASTFDSDRRALSGASRPLTEPVDEDQSNRGENSYSVSATGVLVWKHGFAPDYQLIWFDRQGRSIGSSGSPTRLTGEPFAPRLSPDSTYLAFQDRSAHGERRGIWALDLQRNLATRVHPNLGQYPQWSTDGRQLAWTMPFNAGPGIYVKAATGVGTPELLVKAGADAGGNTFLNDWSKDGRFILYHTRGAKTRIDVWAAPMFGDRKPYPLLNTEFDDGPAQISPDGRWLAYRSDASGSHEIYVQSFSADGKLGGDRMRISTSGGTQPRFRADGQELFYLANDGTLMAVAISTGATFQHAEPKVLFKTRTLPRIEQVQWEYDVTRDGQRFVIATILDGPHATPPAPTILLNWMAELRK